MARILDRATMRDALRIAGCEEPNRQAMLRCPFHDDPNPSFKIVGPRGLEQGWTCFGCGKRGGIFDFLTEANIASDHAHAAEILEARLGESSAARPRDERAVSQRQVVEHYTYVSEDGSSVGRVDRFEPKSFAQYRHEGGQFVAGLGGRALPLYRLNELRTAAQNSGKGFICEGERKSDALRDALRRSGSNAAVTTIAGGAKAPLRDEHVAAFAGLAQLIILADSDEPGRLAARIRASAIARAYAACDVRIVDLYPDRSDGSDIEDWLAEGHDLKALRTLVDAAPRTRPPQPPASPERTKNPRTDGAALTTAMFLRGDDDVAHLIEGLLPAAGSAIVGGKKKVGKGVFLLNAARAVARGTEFLGRRCTPGKVLYLSLDESASITRERAGMLGINEDDPIVWVASRTRPRDWETWLRGLVAQERPDLLIADTMVKLAGITKIEDYGAWNEAYRPLYALADEFGCAFMVSAHNRKAGENNPDSIAGSTAAGGGVDTIIVLDRGVDGTRTVLTEQRHGEDLERCILRMDRETLELSIGPEAWLANQREVEQRILTVLGTESLTREEIITRSSRRTLIVKRALGALIDAGIVDRKGRGVRGDAVVYRAVKKSGPRIDEKPVTTDEKVGPKTSNVMDGTQRDQETQGTLLDEAWSKLGDQDGTAKDQAGPRIDEDTEVIA